MVKSYLGVVAARGFRWSHTDTTVHNQRRRLCGTIGQMTPV